MLVAEDDGGETIGAAAATRVDYDSRPPGSAKQVTAVAKGAEYGRFVRALRSRPSARRRRGPGDEGLRL